MADFNCFGCYMSYNYVINNRVGLCRTIDRTLSNVSTGETADIMFTYGTSCGKRSRDSSVGIATGYGLDDQSGGNSSPGRVKIFTSPYRPDRLWGPPNLL
jgi:hypothetical protein